MATKREIVLELLKQKPLVLSQELTAEGIDRKTIKRMTDSGELIRVARGLYSAADYIPDSNHSLLEAHKLVRQGVICLLSALAYYEIGTQNPSMVWMAIPNRNWRPRLENSPVQIVRFSGKSYTEGINEINIDNEAVRIYNIPKTVADCFKYRNKIGLDIAIEALKDVLQQKKAAVDELLYYAAVCRVRSVIIPYLESLI